MSNVAATLPAFELFDSSQSAKPSKFPDTAATGSWSGALEMRLSSLNGQRYVADFANHLKNEFSGDQSVAIQNAMRDAVLKQAGWGILSELLACS